MLIRRESVSDVAAPSEADAPEPGREAAAQVSRTVAASVHRNVLDGEKRKAIANDASAGVLSRHSEEALRSVLRRLPLGAKASVELELDVKLKAAFGGKLTAEVERTADGRYNVTIGGASSFGAGLGAVVADASLVAGAGTKVTMSFASAEEAADKTAALAQVSVPLALRAANVPGQALDPIRSFNDPDATSRAFSSLDNVTKLQFEVSATLAASGGEGQFVIRGAELGGKAKGAEKLTVQVDLAKRTLTVEQGIELNGSASLPVNWGIGEGELTSGLKVRNEVKLTDAEVAKVRAGELSASELLRTVGAGHRQELVVSVTGKLSTVKARFERVIAADGQLPANLLTLTDPMQPGWSCEATYLIRQKAGLDLAKAVTASGTGALELPLLKRDGPPLVTLVEIGKQIWDEHTRSLDLEGNRALAQLD